jgi:hypothetical protein
MRLKLGSVLSDVFGKSGRAILTIPIAEETGPEKLADLGRTTPEKRRTEPVEAWTHRC